MVTLPTRADWPEHLRDDFNACYGFMLVSNSAAIEACTHLIDSGQAGNDQRVSLHIQRGFNRRLSEPDLALDDYNAALKLQTDEPHALMNRAWIYMSRGQLDAALQDINIAINALSAESAARGRALYYRGHVFLTRKDYDRALVDLNEALKLDRGNPDAYLARGKVEQVQRKFDAALSDFYEFTWRQPRSPEGLIARGAVLEETGRPREAVTALQGALKLDPENPIAHAALDRLGVAPGLR